MRASGNLDERKILDVGAVHDDRADEGHDGVGRRIRDWKAEYAR